MKRNITSDDIQVGIKYNFDFSVMSPPPLSHTVFLHIPHLRSCRIALFHEVAAYPMWADTVGDAHADVVDTDLSSAMRRASVSCGRYSRGTPRHRAAVSAASSAGIHKMRTRHSALHPDIERVIAETKTPVRQCCPPVVPALEALEAWSLDDNPEEEVTFTPEELQDIQTFVENDLHRVFLATAWQNFQVFAGES